MTLREYPRRQMHLDVYRIDFSRLQVARLAYRISLRTVNSSSSNLRDCSIGRHIRQPSEPVRERRSRGGLQQSVRSPEDGDILFQGSRVVYQTERVNRPRIA